MFDEIASWLNLPNSMGTKWIFIFSFLIFRYALIAGMFFLIFYQWKKSDWHWKKIQVKFPQGKDYRREILYSISTFIIFASIAVIIFSPWIRPYTQIYKDIHQHSMAWWGMSVVLMIFLHDTYFYWTHRWMHHPKVYPIFHKVHHLSINPSPWASFAFHPFEAVVEFSILILIAFIIPAHPTAIVTFLLWMTVYNVYGHLGYELFPASSAKNYGWKWLNTSVNHNQHHHYFKGNYGLYFQFWDRLLGTTRADYDTTFEQIGRRKKPYAGGLVDSPSNPVSN